MLRNRPFLTTGALFMGLIILLGTIGVVNGLWSKNLLIEGTVTTGDLNADWDCGWTNDDGENFEAPDTGPCSELVDETGDDGLDPFGNFDFPYSDPFIQKDVGHCEVEIDSPETQPFGAQVAQVLITNAYPSYECTITMALSNTGSIPFNYIGAELFLDQEQPIELLDDNCTFPDTGTQVDPNGQELLIECTVHVQQEAEQNICTADTITPTPVVVGNVNCVGPEVEEDLVSYEFEIFVCVAQWNESATYEQCKGSEQHEGPEPPTPTVD